MGGGKNNNKRHAPGTNNSEDKKRRREKEENWKNTRGDANPQRNSWSSQIVENKRFENFYKAQGFLTEEEWPAYMDSLRSSLPACFRINPDYAFVEQLKEQLLSFVGQKIVLGGVEIDGVKQMEWLKCAYKLGTDRKAIRKLPGLEGLHKWMMRHTDCGNITRQEAVSMVPPLALNVSPSHKCLDMCAAPGSKTSQLLEIVTRSLAGPPEDQGLVVANDSDTDRAYMLVHQCRRINSPLLIVTTHKGQMFPTIKGDVKLKKDGYFDRVLCDVPCSGDGTLRKNPAIWGKWSTSSGFALHPLQLIIAQRGVQLLKTGGLMVYSTCSMSPYEDEAVIAELLRQYEGQLELVDAREFIPLFKARPGMSNWHVMDDHQAINKEKNERKINNKKMKLEKKVEEAAAEGVISMAATSEVAAEGTVGDSFSAVTDAFSAVSGVLSSVSEATANAAIAAANAIAAGITGAETSGAVDGSGIEVSEITGENTEIDTTGQPVAGSTSGSNSSNINDRDSFYVSPKSDDPAIQTCIDMGMQHFPSYSAVPDYLQRKMRKSFFPPTEEEKKWMHLELCLRCVPHDEDTGGFFVATLRKVGKPSVPASSASASASSEGASADMSDEKVTEVVISEEDQAAMAEAEAAGADTEEKAPKTEYRSDRGLVDFQPFDSVHYKKIQEFYGLTDGCPNESMFVREDAMAVKSGKNVGAKSVYFIPKPVRDFMVGGEDKVKTVTAGIKVLERMDKGKGSKGGEEYRLVQDGIQAIVGHITSRKVYVKCQDFCNLLAGGLCSLSTMHADTFKVLTGMASGALICVYKYDPADILPPAVVEGESSSAVKMETEDLKPSGEDISGEEIPDHCFYVICWR